MIVFCSAASAQSRPGGVIKNFYYWYIHEVDAGRDPFTKGRKTLLTYVTPGLVKQVERAEAHGEDTDIFLQTQEFDVRWADNCDASEVRINGTTATAIVNFDAETHYPRLSVTLIKEGSLWKINKVRNAPLR